MKGPHFFEKRKKEMARQDKAKQKAERKAQRKARQDRGEPEPEETFDEFGQLIEGGAAAAGDEQQDAEGATGRDDDSPTPGGQTP